MVILVILVEALVLILHFEVRDIQTLQTPTESTPNGTSECSRIPNALNSRQLYLFDDQERLFQDVVPLQKINDSVYQTNLLFKLKGKIGFGTEYV